MICKKCGTENPDTATFCTECGNPLKREKYEMASVDEPLQQYQKIEFPNQDKEDFTLPPAPVIENPEDSPRFVDFKGAVKLYFSNALNFNGRSTRSEYWYSMVFYIIICITAAIISSAAKINLLYLPLIILFVPNVSALVRRMHDISENGLPAAVYYAFYTIYDFYYNLTIKPAILNREKIKTTSFFIPILLLAAGIYFIKKCCTMSDMKENKYGRKPH